MRCISKVVSESSSFFFRLKGSLESQLCWMVFCWGKHMKECFVKVDTSGALRQTGEGGFTEADTGERMFC